MGVRVCTKSQVKTWWSEEDFNYTANPLGHCWECSQPGHVKTKCPKLEQSRMSDRRRKDEDVCCYNCNECGHYARDCLLPKRRRKKQESWRFEDENERILRKIMQERNMKPREHPLLSNVRSLQHRVNSLSKDQKKTSYARFKV